MEDGGGGFIEEEGDIRGGEALRVVPGAREVKVLPQHFPVTTYQYPRSWQRGRAGGRGQEAGKEARWKAGRRAGREKTTPVSGNITTTTTTTTTISRIRYSVQIIVFL
ncbi:hypothetical protein E2C01_085931 [Portunus trituberculatus]|uniref:Uncharacterized protein n=1 Tax=Portunus trituberculatus TaxID=210409 RepID=A0A5B7JC28_PORTR|nr:hypothetical protein [Portunus trituberculatus]